MFSRFAMLMLVVGASVLSGCASTKNMSFGKDQAATIPQDKAIVLISASMRNEYKVSYQPKILVAHMEKGTAEKSSDPLNFKHDAVGAAQGNNLFRMELENGAYVLRGMTGHALSFPINGFYMAPVHAEINITAPGVYYMGHIDAVIRERQGNEFKAGGSLPLIDQALAGASTGTFDITITDQWTTDEKAFKAEFPVLNGIDIKKVILPAFDRQRAQTYWEKN